MTGLTSKVDRFGDDQLRKTDEHIIKQPRKLFLRLLSRLNLKGIAQIFYPHTMRRRGSKEEITANAQRLGLGATYGIHEKGIEILSPEIYTHGYPLQDIFRQDIVRHPLLEKIDRKEALNTAAAYLGTIHANYGYIGEVLPNDIIFQKANDYSGATVMSEPVLNLPDIVYNPVLDEKHTDSSRIAMDLMDFIFSISLEEIARVNRDGLRINEENFHDLIAKLITQLLTAYSENYDENKKQVLQHILTTLKSFVKRGRLTTTNSKQTSIVNNVFFAHNKVRLENYDEGVYSVIRPAVDQAIVQVLKNIKQSSF